MRKLKLSLEALHVESFRTSTGSGTAPGTVRGHQSLSYLSCVNCPSQNPCSGYPAQCGSSDGSDNTGPSIVTICSCGSETVYTQEPSVTV